MIVKTIPSTWLIEEEHRLDCGPFVKGGIEARKTIEGLRYQKDHLVDLTENGINGMYHVGQDKIVWAEDEIHGMPFLRSADILRADLSYQPFISRKQVAGNYLFQCPAGATLITRSGTIGRMAFMRTDMEDTAISQDVLKVIPDEEKVKPGYLYAFLNSKYGIPIITGGTFGSIIVHIEAENIADLPVPRLDAVEDQAHELIQGAADLRVEATELLKTAGQMVNDQFGFPEKLALSHRVFSCSTASSTLVLKRLEATFHDAVAQESDRLIAGVPRKDEFSTLGIAISETGRLKQVFVDEEYGAPFLTSGEIFRQRYEPTRFLSNRLLPDESEWATQEGDLLLARSGQVGGIIGRGVWADRRFAGGCVSVDVLRLGAQNSQILPGYLYAYLFLTDVGYRQLIRTAAGSSIPHLSAPDVSRLLIPRCDNALEAEINELVWNAGHKRAEAQEKEDQARALVERTNEEGGR